MPPPMNGSVCSWPSIRLNQRFELGRRDALRAAIDFSDEQTSISQKKTEKYELGAHELAGCGTRVAMLLTRIRMRFDDGRGSPCRQLRKLQNPREIDRHCHDDEAGQSVADAAADARKKLVHIEFCACRAPAW